MRKTFLIAPAPTDVLAHTGTGFFAVPEPDSFFL